jgi:hypothetical protein
MKLSAGQIDDLLKALNVTKDKELNGNECLGLVGEFAESNLQGSGTPKALEAVKHHLALCAECREEYESLFKALETLGNHQDRTP